VGFGKVANLRYNVDIDLLLAQYGHRIVAGEEVPHDQFRIWIEAAVAKA